jgi:signal transduction histidine kinase
VWLHLCFSEAETLLTIRDDGVGFAPSTAGNGGLGLASLKERAEKIGGRLEIDSTPGEGTQIRIVVPADSAPERHTEN